MPRLITSSSVKISIPLANRLTDIFQPEEQIVVEWVAPENDNVSLFAGLYDYEKNVTETFTIKGKPGFCAFVLSELNHHGLVIDKRTQSKTVKFWIHLTGRRM
jgi:hypothetical protein